MKILIITQMFSPEMGAPTSRLTSLANGLKRAGHEVIVATGMPNYPAGKVFPEYRGRIQLRDETEGFEVFRTHYYTCPRNRSKVQQLISYLSFLPSVFFSSLRAGRIDVVMVSSPPIFPILVGIAIAWLRRAKLVFDLRDLWPDEIVACGGARAESLPIKTIGMIERLGYRCSDLILCTTRTFLETVTTRGADKASTIKVPNGADTDLFRPLTESRDTIRAKHNVADKFVVMYSGAIGLKHGLDIAIEAAVRLREHTEIVFVFVGDGAARTRISETVRKEHLQNVRFWGAHPLDEIPDFLSAADLCFTSLLPHDYLRSILAVKLFEYMACQKPIVAAVHGESAEVVDQSGAGLATPPGDAEAFSNAILELRHDAKRRSQMADNGLRFVERHFSRTDIANEMAAEFTQRFEQEP